MRSSGEPAAFADCFRKDSCQTDGSLVSDALRPVNIDYCMFYNFVTVDNIIIYFYFVAMDLCSLMQSK